MKILIKSATIIDQGSPYHNQSRDLMIEGGIVGEAPPDSTQADLVVEAEGMLLSPGWFDLRALFCDPGHEYREDLESGCSAAAAGGFTGVALLPNTLPVLQTKNQIGHIKARNAERLVNLFPMASVTLDTKGEALTEMIDLHTAGAVAFTDGEKPLWHTDILLKTLQYLQKFDGLLATRPEDPLLTKFGSMNEGVNSTILGMRGMPKLAEEVVVARDLALLAYAGGRLHFSNISSAKSVELIRQAKQQGLQATCDIAAHQPVFDDGALTTFDTAYKTSPPFREPKDNKALLDGLKDGTIDAIVSSHTPHDEEGKKLEFDLAEFGMIGLQTVGHCLAQMSATLEWPLLIDKITHAPRKILKLPQPSITPGQNANLTLFDPKADWVFDASTNYSKSQNSPFFGKRIAGRAVAAFNNGQYWLAEDRRGNQTH